MTTMKDDLDPRVDAALEEYLSPDWADITMIAHVYRARMARTLAAADAARPAMTVEDAGRAIGILADAMFADPHGRLSVAERGYVALCKHFNITPKVKP